MVKKVVNKIVLIVCAGLILISIGLFVISVRSETVATFPDQGVSVKYTEVLWWYARLSLLDNSGKTLATKRIDPVERVDDVSISYIDGGLVVLYGSGDLIWDSSLWKK